MFSIMNTNFCRVYDVFEVSTTKKTNTTMKMYNPYREQLFHILITIRIYYVNNIRTDLHVLTDRLFSSSLIAYTRVNLVMSAVS